MATGHENDVETFLLAKEYGWDLGECFWNRLTQWSTATFGPSRIRDHIGPLKHLAKEAVEAQVRPANPEEIADCLFLVFDAARRAGLTYEELIEAAFAKLAINRKREWGPPGGDNAIEHVREKSEPAPTPTHDGGKPPRICWNSKGMYFDPISNTVRIVDNTSDKEWVFGFPEVGGGLTIHSTPRTGIK